ncbi:MAG: nucleotidyl transferase AbiEii/AbiGii toxin family protein [bacterium]|nr:nucleotidyl transferase AbiEii/AbiGii toxin family protein [bacterium]
MRTHKEILTKEQLELLSLIEEFGKDFILVGGTAIALHVGHRRSIDFDLFSYKVFDNRKIKRIISRYLKIEKTYISQEGEYTMMINGVKLTFFNFHYKIKASLLTGKVIRFPDLLTLAAMKAFALGFRSKWKDYVDLYFIMRDYHSLEEISKKADKIFGGEFSGRIFREALSYFDDVNYVEKVDFMKGFEVSDAVIKRELTKFSIS